MGFMELRAATVGFRVRSLRAFFLLLVQLKSLKVDNTWLPNGSRSEETVKTKNKTKTQGESFLFLFCQKK